MAAKLEAIEAVEAIEEIGRPKTQVFFFIIIILILTIFFIRFVEDKMNEDADADGFNARIVKLVITIVL